MFGFISTREHKAILAAKDAQIALLEKELADRRQGEHRLTDLVFKHQFNEQVYDSLPKSAEVVAPEPELTPSQQLEEEYKQSKASELQELRMTARRSPSKLGPKIAEQMKREHSARAKAAHPAQELFRNAAAEVKQ